MSLRPSITVILAHVILWTFYFNPLDYIFRFEKYRHTFNDGFERHRIKSTDHIGSSQKRNTWQIETLRTRTYITKDILQVINKYSKGIQINFPSYELLKRKGIKTQNDPEQVTTARKNGFPTILGDVTPVFKKNSSSGSRIKRGVNDTVSKGDRAISKAKSSTRNAFARSYATGAGFSQAEAVAKNGDNATALAKAHENNSSAAATSIGGGHALSASESGGSGNASSVSISQGNGSSRAEGTVLEGQLVVTGIHDIASGPNNTEDNLPLEFAHDSSTDINFDDPFFRSIYQTTQPPNGIPSSATGNDGEHLPFQMGGRTFDAKFENLEQQSAMEPTTSIIPLPNTEKSDSIPNGRPSSIQQDNLLSKSEQSMPPSMTENNSKRMPFYMGGGTYDIEFKKLEEQSKMEVTTSIIPSSVTEKSVTIPNDLQSAIEHDLSTYMGHGLTRSKPEHAIQTPTTENKARDMPFQVGSGKTLDGGVEILKEQSTFPTVSDVIFSTTESSKHIPNGVPSAIDHDILLSTTTKKSTSLSKTSENGILLSITTDRSDSVSKANSSTRNAYARSYARGLGYSQAEAVSRKGENATALANAHENNSSAAATSIGGGHVLAASESGASGKASSVSISQGNGSSKAEATVLEGDLLVTGIHDITSGSNNTDGNPPFDFEHDSSTEINFDDSFFRSIYQTTQATNDILSSATENKAEHTPFQMSDKVFNAEFENLEQQSTTEETKSIIPSPETEKSDSIPNGVPSAIDYNIFMATKMEHENPVSKTEHTMPSVNTENQSRRMPLQVGSGRTINGGVEILTEQSTTDPTASYIPLSATKKIISIPNGMPSAMDYVNHQSTKPEHGIPLSKIEHAMPTSTTENEGKRGVSYTGGETLDGEFENWLNDQFKNGLTTSIVPLANTQTPNSFPNGKPSAMDPENSWSSTTQIGILLSRNAVHGTELSPKTTGGIPKHDVELLTTKHDNVLSTTITDQHVVSASKTENKGKRMPLNTGVETFDGEFENRLNEQLKLEVTTSIIPLKNTQKPTSIPNGSPLAVNHENSTNREHVHVLPTKAKSNMPLSTNGHEISPTTNTKISERQSTSETSNVKPLGHQQIKQLNPCHFEWVEQLKANLKILKRKIREPIRNIRDKSNK